MDAPAPFDIADWLGRLGPEFAGYAAAFRANDVDAEVLRLLSAEDLREMGVVSIGHRRRILAAAAMPVAVPEVEPAGERRLLTVMFCDLVDSTALSVETEAEDYVDFISRFRTEIGKAITPFAGTIANYLGDGVLAIFGYPHASDHDAERAVAAGLAVVEVVGAMPPFGTRAPRVRVGIATGLAVVSGADAGALRDLSAIGETSNLAARLQALAGPDEVVISDRTRAMTGALFDCLDLGTPAMKGISRPERAWRVTGRSAVETRFEALRGGAARADFVGRRVEKAALVAHLGAGGALVLEGEPGIGKSRLLREALAEAGLGRPVMLQCSPYASGVALNPVRYLLVRETGIAAGGDASTALARLAALLAGAGLDGPEPLALLEDFVGVGAGEAAALRGMSSGEQRGRLMRLLGRLLPAMARAAGALVVEDADWLDPSTLELLEGVMAALGPVPSVWTARRGGLAGWAAGLPVLSLDRLTPEDVRALIADLGGGRVMPPDVAEAIVARSDGVPIFAEELARGWLEAAEGDAAPVPMTLTESLLARLDRMPRGRRIAALAAAIGREFPVAILVAVADLPEALVMEGVEELLAADILRPGESQFGVAVRFRHNLVRDAAYETLLRRQRAALHERIADVIEARYPEIARAVPHVMAAQRAAAGQHELASAEWERAAREAMARSAYAEAAAFCERALAETLALAAGRERDRRELELRVTLLGALICARGYQSEEAARETARVSALAEGLGELTGLLAALQARWVQLGSSNNVVAMLDFALKAREALKGAPPVDRLIATRMCATSLLFRGYLPEALREYEAFMADYDPARHQPAMRTGHSDHACMVMLGMAEALVLMDLPDRADVWRMRALEDARASGRLHDRCHTLSFAGCFHPLLMRRDAEAARHARELAQVLEQHDLPNWVGYRDLFEGVIAARAGGASGLAMARRGIEALKGARAFGNWWHLLYAEACLDAGEQAEAAAVLEAARSIAAMGEGRLAPEVSRLGALSLLARGGDPERAVEMLGAGLALAEQRGAALLRRRIEQDLARIGVPAG